jgi:cbb3-type cytochrome oxidase cytochrome c subunit
MSVKRKKFAKIALYLVVASALVVSLIAGRCEREILAEKQRTADAVHRNTLQVKGRIYFVTDSQLYCHEIGKILFIGEIVIAFILILVLRRPDKVRSES